MPRSSAHNPFHSLASASAFLSSSSTNPSSSPSPAAPHLAVPLLLPVSSASTSSSTSSPESRRGPQPMPGARMAGAAASSGGKAERGVRGGGGGGPAFVGQVFTMLDPSGSGNGLMAVTTRFELPRFLTNRTPTWFKRIFSH